jgi:hypothetical protein
MRLPIKKTEAAPNAVIALVKPVPVATHPKVVAKSIVSILSTKMITLVL